MTHHITEQRAEFCSEWHFPLLLSALPNMHICGIEAATCDDPEIDWDEISFFCEPGCNRPRVIPTHRNHDTSSCSISNNFLPFSLRVVRLGACVRATSATAWGRISTRWRRAPPQRRRTVKYFFSIPWLNAEWILCFQKQLEKYYIHVYKIHHVRIPTAMRS